MHKDVNSLFMCTYTDLVVQKYERQANLFAATLLITPDIICDLDDNMTIKQLSQQIYLPADVIEQVLNISV